MTAVGEVDLNLPSSHRGVGWGAVCVSFILCDSLTPATCCLLYSISILPFSTDN